jgi:PAS domain-containing protein
MFHKLKRLLFPEEKLIQPGSGAISNSIWLGQLYYFGVSLFIFFLLLRYHAPQEISFTLIGLFVTVHLFQNYLYWKSHFDAARYVFYGAANFFLFIFSSFLGSHAGIYLLFFPLISSTVAVYGLNGKKQIILMVVLSFAALGLLDLTDHQLFAVAMPGKTLRTLYLLNFLLSLSFIIYFVSHLVLINKRTHAVLQESEAKLSSILNALDEIIWAVSVPDYRLIYLNKAADQVFEFPDASFLQTSASGLNWCMPRTRRRMMFFTKMYSALG